MELIRKRRTLSYKLFSCHGETRTLQELLEGILIEDDSDFALVENRREFLSQDEKAVRMINTAESYDSPMLLCQLVMFERDSSQMTISLVPSARCYKISPFLTTDIKKTALGKKADEVTTEFVESILYFGVVNNHMVIMNSKALGSRELEKHLIWLLRTHTSKVAEGAIFLSDKPSSNAMKQLEKSAAKSVKIGSDVSYEAEAKILVGNTEPEEQTIVKTKSVFYRAKDFGAEIIEFLKATGRMPELELDDCLDDANLHVNLEFKFNRKTTTNGQKVMDQLATSMRHMHDEDVKIELVGGGEIRGADIKLSTPVTVVFNSRGELDERDLHEKMRSWLRSKISTDEVSPDLVELVTEEV